MAAESMMNHTACRSGIDAVGELPWGSHFCHLYRTREDLVDTLVPFFAAGLEHNEQCLWVTAAPLGVEDATWELSKRVPNLQGKLDRGQIRIIDHSEWYTRTGKIDPEWLLQAWVEGEQSARERGYAGLRATGNVTFLKTTEERKTFAEYESRVTEAFAGRRLTALCSYGVEMPQARNVLDVVCDHQFTLVRRDLDWKVLENAAVALAKDELRQSNTELEHRLHARTSELEQTVALLRAQGRELERALQERDVAARAKDDFLAMLAHELRNPLAPITTALQLMRLRGIESREQEILDRQVAHLTRLVDDLLDISRITRGKIELQRRPVEFSQIVIRATELVGSLLEQHQQRLELAVPREGLLVNVDPERMAQVVGNLLTNASKYSDARSRILLSCAREGNKLICSIKDEGIGIEPEMLGSVFDAFVQQSHTLHRARGGLGLGLAIVRSLVTEHGGSVRAESQGLGRGSEFIIELPALEGPRAKATAVYPSESSACPAVSPTSRRILIVDDNPDAVEMLKEALEALGHTVIGAHDAASALAHAQTLQPDFALIDIQLPVVSGYELAEQLRSACAAHGGARLIALTGYGQPADRRRSRAAGFSQHLVKPVDLAQLTHLLAEGA